jgi:hypothetical protein
MIDYVKFYKDIETHVEMLVTPEMRQHAYADAKEHDLSFQIFRLLSGYSACFQESLVFTGKTSKPSIHLLEQQMELVENKVICIPKT